LLFRAAAHESGHAFAHYLLTKRMPGVEVEWAIPGSGACYARCPEDWPDDPAKFFTYSGVTDAAGAAGEVLLVGYADLTASKSDQDAMQTAAAELLTLAPEYKSGTPRELASLFREMAEYLLAPHRPAMEFIAGRISRKSHWYGGELEDALLHRYPQYHQHRALFEGDWRKTWLTLLDDLTTTLERKVGWATPQRLQAMERKIMRLGADMRWREGRNR
jgi:hypothetical protein